MGQILPQSFYEKKTDKVAQALIGQILVRRLPTGELLKSIITETEAYLGIEDKACHTYNGRKTDRVSVMWGPAGRVYVYFIYGMYFCLNVVTRKEGEPEAVLIRGARPVEDEVQRKLWVKVEPDSRKWGLIMSGPGKLCRTLEINKQLNGAPLVGDELWIEEGYKVPSKTILKTPRIGIGYSEEAKDWPLRFVWNSGSLYESLFQHHQNRRSNSSRQNAKNRQGSKSGNFPQAGVL